MNRRSFSLLLLKIGVIIPILKNSSVFASYPKEVNQGRNVFNALDYGCKAYVPGSDDYTDNRECLQGLLNRLHEINLKSNKSLSIYLPDGVFYLSSTMAPKVYGMPGAFCLQLYSNINIIGEGTLKLLPKQYGKGAFFRMLASDRNSLIHDVTLSGITIDGNKSQQIEGVQASNILLECECNVYVDNIKSINANGNGILIRGVTEPDRAVKNVVITDCTVINCNKIGIQVSQFKGLIIKGNKVNTCKDNGIDIYGDLGKNEKSRTNGNNFEIYHNEVKNCLNGIFPETVSNGLVYANKLSDLKESGVHINRIHGAPVNISIYNNEIANALSGFSVTGDMKNIRIYNNNLHDIRDYFFSFGSGKGNVSGVVVNDNDLNVRNGMKAMIFYSGVRVNDLIFTRNKLNERKGHPPLAVEANTSQSLIRSSVIFE